MPIRLANEERFLELPVEASDLLLRLYSWGCDSHGRFPADKRALKRTTGIDHSVDQALAEIQRRNFVELYEIEGRKFGQIVEYDLDIPANLIAKRGQPEYPKRPNMDETHVVSPVGGELGETKGSLSQPLNLNINENVNNIRESAGASACENEVPPKAPFTYHRRIKPTIEMVREDCREFALQWLQELDEQRKTDRRGKGVKNAGVLGSFDTIESLGTQYADQLAKMADRDPMAFRRGVESMIDGGKGWIMNPIKYLSGACMIASEGKGKKSKKRGKRERRIGPQGENVTVEKVEVEQYDDEALEFLGIRGDK